MRRTYPELPRYTWDQAEILTLFPASAFEKLGIRATVIRRWATDGHVHRVGIGPNGHVLYLAAEIIGHADKKDARVA